MKYLILVKFNTKITVIDKNEVEINANVLIRLFYYLHGPYECSLITVGPPAILWEPKFRGLVQRFSNLITDIHMDAQAACHTCLPVLSFSVSNEV